jgi:hypothetical protein
MDREHELLQILKERGPISVKRLKTLTGLKKRCINGALHGSKKTAKVESAPYNSANKRPLWSYAAAPVRPVKIVKRKITVSEDN